MAVEDLVGKIYPPFEVTVEGVKIFEFRRALGESADDANNPVAPPTFTRNFWWEGTAVHSDLGFAWENVLHGEQEFLYYRPLRAGQRLTATMRIAEVYRKRGGRGGTMTFAVVETSYRDEAGMLAVVGRRTLIETEPRLQHEEAVQPASIAPADFASLQVGDEATLRVGPLTRTDFVRYAGASGDFNPNHHDDIAAIRAGNERPFGMGMLAAGYLARLLEYWLPAGSLRRYRTRFVTRFWPGDILTCRAMVTRCVDGDGDRTIECDVGVDNAHAQTVIRGDATAVAPIR